MPGVVQPPFAQASLLKQPLPLVVVGVRDERLTRRAGEHPAFVMLKLASFALFLFLCAAVLAEQSNQLDRQADGAAARPWT
jgi:hypothetical protein